MTVGELEELIMEYGKAIYSFCCYLTGSVQKAEDLYQEILLTALEIREKIVTDENDDLQVKYARAKNYLIGIGVHLWKRKQGKRRRFFYELSLDDEEYGISKVAADGVDVEEIMEEREIRAAMYRAVSQLPEKFRVVIFMHYTSGMTVEEMAKVLHLSKGTVKSRLFHARKRRKEKMEAMGYEV